MANFMLYIIIFKKNFRKEMKLLMSQTTLVAILNKNVIFFFYKIGEQKAEQVLPGGLVPVGGVGGEESVWEGDHSTNIVYTCL
jgi:hypothetical protein